MEIVEETMMDTKDSIQIPLKKVAEDSKKSDEMIVTEDAFHKMDVPGDANCLFWAITMSYLLPVKNNESLFSERFQRLFGSENVNKTLGVQELLLSQNINIVYEDETLIELVTKMFRNFVVDEMMKQEEEVYQSVTLDDFLRMKNEVFITHGTFFELFQTAFPTQAHLVNLSKLKPAQLNQNSIDVMNAELGNVSDNNEMQKFKFSAYLKAMRECACWAGEREMRAIQKLLQCQIFVFSEENSTFNIDEDNSVNICLFNANEGHYEFGLVKPKIVIENIIKLNYKLAFTLVKIGISDVNYRYNNDWTLLHFAALTNDYQNIIKHLIWQGEDPSLTTEKNHTPLQMAEYFGLKKAIASLQSLTDTNTLAMATIGLPDKQLNVESNIENQTSVNKNNNSRTNYLLFSSSNNIIKKLLNVPTQNIIEQTPLSPNILENAFRFVLQLIEKKENCDINLFTIRLKDNGNNNNKEFSNWSPLHYAVKKGSLELVICFSINGKAKIDVKDHNGGTSLHRAVKNGHFEMLKYLLERGADINAKNNATLSPLSYAAINGYAHIVHYLIENGAEIDTLDKDGMTPVHHAVKCGHWSAVECLVEHKADVNIQDNNNKTPLSRLVEKSKWHMVELLLKNGALLIGLSEKHKHNINKQFILSLDKDIRLLRAIALGNVELLQILVLENQNKLEKPMLKIYHKLKLLNVPLTQDMRMFLENKLMNNQYFFSGKQLTEMKTKVDDNAENVRMRIKLTAKCIDALNTFLVDNNNEIDDIFLFNGKCVAKNMQILKRQLRSTYEVLPWEEMHFYLVFFLYSCIEPNRVEDITYLVMHKTKLMKYLLMFKKELEKLNVVAELLLKNANNKTRDEIKSKVIGKNAQFEDLYNDFEHLRDVHSLKRIEEYVKIACAVDLNADPVIGQLAIERALQVMGECLKNTRDSPNLSRNVNEMLLTFAPKNVKNIVTTLRDSLSHAAQTLTQIQNMKGEREANYFRDIQNDLKKLKPEMTFISFRKRCAVVKSFLEQIISSKNIDAICINESKIRYENMCKLEDEGSNNCIIKISDYLNQLKTLLNDRITPFQAKCFETIDTFINEKKKNEEIRNNHSEYFFKIKILIDLIKNKKDLDNIHRLARSILSQFLCANYDDEDKNFGHVFSLFVVVRDSLLLNVNDEEEAKEIINQIMHVIKFEAEKIQSIDQFKEDFSVKRQSIDLKRLDDDILSFIRQICDTIEKQNVMIEEYEDTKTFHNCNYNLIKFFNNNEFSEGKNPVDENLFRSWMEKIKFKVPNSNNESISSLYHENNQEKRQKMVQRLKRPNAYRKLLKALENRSFTNEFSNEIRQFLETFASFKSDEKLKRKIENKLLKAFLLENRNILESVLSHLKTDRDLLIFLRTNDAFQAAIEMLMLKIVETLENNNNLRLLETNPTFLDEPIPTLIGKNMRNYLAHGDLLIDLLSIDYLKSIIFHIRTIQNHCSNTNLVVNYDGTKRAGSQKVENITDLEKCYAMSLKLLIKQKKIITTVKENNMKKLKSMTNNKLELKYRNFKGWTLLFYTAETDNLEMFTYLFKYQKSIYYRDKLGYSFLYYLAKHGSIKIITYLVEHKIIDPNVTLHNGKSLLHVSSRYGQNEIAKFLLTNNTDANARDSEGKTAIFLATINNHADVVSSLIKYGAELRNVHTTDSTLLHYAAMEGSAQVLQLLLDNHLEVDREKFYSQTPLHGACLCGHENVVHILLKNGARINAAANYGVTPLTYAAQEGHEQIVTFLLNNGADVNLLTTAGETALHLAAFSGHVKVVKILLNTHFDPNARTLEGVTPLHFACSSNHYEVIKLLLLDDDRTDINAVNAEGVTPFHKVAEVGDAALIEMMLEQGADINFATQTGYSPLYLAAQSNCTKIVELLLKRGADINARSQNEKTPLYAAVIGQKLDTIRLLLKNNAAVSFAALHIAVQNGYAEGVKALISKYDVNCPFEEGNTLLHLAATIDIGQIVQLLLENGADVKLVNSDGFNAFHVAVQYASVKVVETMLKANVDIVDVQSEGGTIPLQKAAIGGHVDLVRMLIDKGANVNLASSKNHWTALHLAAANGYFEVVKCLLDNGAEANARAIDGSTPLHALNCPQIFAECNVFPKNSPNGKKSRGKSVEYLISAGAETNALDEHKRSPLHLAAIASLHNMIKILHENNAFLDARDAANFTPLDYAVVNGDVRCIMYLLMFGAVDTRGISVNKHFTELF